MKKPHSRTGIETTGLIAGPKCNVNGFTLPELLVATIIAAGLVAITAQVMIGQLLEGRRLESAQRVRENFSRLNYLVQIESSEANEILGSAPSVPGCEEGADEGFTLLVPIAVGQYALNENRSAIQYFNDEAGNIRRCGPRVNRAGILNHAQIGSDGSTHVENIVVPNAQLTVGCEGGGSNRAIGYTVDFAGGNFGAQVGECVIARARSIFVCNPPPSDSSIPLAPGDCPR